MSILPVLISGSGPTGLYLALILARHGVPVRIIEKDLKFHIASRGSAISPRTHELQRILGIDAALLNWGGSTDTPPIRLYQMPSGTQVIKEWKLVDDVPPTPACPVGDVYQVPQMVHERIIREELSKFGVHVELGKELRTFTQDGDGVTAEIVVHSAEGAPDTVEVVRAAYLCGADGAHGPTRKVMECTFLGNTEATDAILFSDHILHGLDHEHMHFWMIADKDGQKLSIGTRSLRDGKGTFNTVIMGGSGFDPSEYMKPGGLAVAFQTLIGRADIQVEEPIVISFFRPNTRMVNKFQEGRVFVLGDAAHVHSPTGGQGLNSSVQDAFNLGWKLALVYKDKAPSSLLATYNEERLPVIAEMLNQTKGLYAKTKDKTEDPSVGSLRRGGPLFQLGVNYRWSSIVMDARESRGTIAERDVEELKAYAYGGHLDGSLVAGDRAPDAPFLLARDGSSTSLFSVFDPTEHTVLVFNPPTGFMLQSKEAVQVTLILPREINAGAKEHTSIHQVLVDTQGHAYTGYGVPEDEKFTIVVVRPDAYVGAVVHSVEGLENYFANVFHI